MADEPIEEPWVTIQLLPPTPNARWAGLAVAELPAGSFRFRAQSIAIDCVALQHQRTVYETEEDGKTREEVEIASRIMPLIIDADGTVIELVGFPACVGLAATQEGAEKLAFAWIDSQRPKPAAAPPAPAPAPDEGARPATTKGDDDAA